MEGHMGDFWSQINSAIDIKAFIPEGEMMNAVADESQPFIPFGNGGVSGFCMRSANYENAPGEWNTLELICFNGKSLHIVNGHVAMILENSRQIEDGKPVPMIKGKIQIQSEAAEVFYKDIRIRNIESMPADYCESTLTNLMVLPLTHLIEKPLRLSLYPLKILGVLKYSPRFQAFAASNSVVVHQIA